MKRLFVAVMLVVSALGLSAQRPVDPPGPGDARSPLDGPRDPTAITRRVGTAGQQPPPKPAEEGFVPVDQLEKKEEIPSAPLVMSAYAVAWLAIFVYVWSIWQRLGKAEREIADLSRRVAAGGRR